MIGQAIRKARQERGITLEALALAAGTDAANLSRIERGKQGYSPDRIERIADALELPLSALYQRAEQETAGSHDPHGPSTGIVDPLDAFRKWLNRLNPGNRELALEFVKMLSRRQERQVVGAQRQSRRTARRS